MTRIALVAAFAALLAAPAAAADLDRTAVDFTTPADIKWVRNMGPYVMRIKWLPGMGPATSTPAGRR
jgi:hypothetical protein